MITRNTRNNPFPWHDSWAIDDLLERKAVRYEALVARTVCLLSALESAAQENADEGGDWVAYGLSEAVKSMAKADNLDGIGVFFTCLEALVEPMYRRRWPLSDWQQRLEAGIPKGKKRGLLGRLFRR